MSKKESQYIGGYVKSPEAGIHKNIIEMDFRSLLPSIIVTFNISPETLNCKHKLCKKNKVPGFKRWFCLKTKGKVAEMVEKALKNRNIIKKKIKKAKGEYKKKLEKKERQLKLVANIAYGKFSWSKSKHYSVKCGEAISAWGRFYVKNAINIADHSALKVIYGDTDSLFMVGNLKKAKLFLKRFNSTLPGIIKLEYRGSYSKGLFVLKKSGKAAKKKYAMMDKKGNLIIKGFAVVRGDWCKLARSTQKKMIKYVLENKKREATIYAKNIIKHLKKGKAKLNDLIISKQLDKNISEYKGNSPHISVARKLNSKAGDIISYIITNKPGKIFEKAMPVKSVKLKNVDFDYYIGHQIVPAIMKVLTAVGVKEEEIL